MPDPIQALLNLLYPPSCPLCRRPHTSWPRSEILCEECSGKLKSVEHPYCPQCGFPFQSEAGEDHLCGRCLSEKRYFSRARSAVVYGDAAGELVSRFKFGGDLRLATFISALMQKTVEDLVDGSGHDLLVPVPLHKQRLRFRGYNQSLILGKKISRRCGIPINRWSLVRIRDTPPQLGLPLAKRRKNVRGAFSVSRPDQIKGKNVLLIDDVFTTGSTVSECSRVLIKAGASKVDVVTLAHVTQS